MQQGHLGPQPDSHGSVWRRIGAFFLNPRNLYLLGLLAVLGLTFSEVAHGRHRNFMIFAESTKLFWNHIAPYGDNWSQLAPHLDYYLYGPLFNVLFAPFAYLPAWLGPFAWNVFNFTLWFLAIFTLPGRFTRQEKCKSFLFTFLILACTQLSFQYNVTVACMFLFAYSLLERDKAFWAVLLIMISGFTKIYGIFQLAMLLFYPHFWRNAGYALLIAVVLAAAPAVAMPFSGLPSYYGEWFGALMSHKDTRTWMNVFYLRPLNLLPYRTYVQAGVLALLAVGVLANRRKWQAPFFRIASLAVLMGYVILFSNSSEGHTYVISLIGYQLWYWTMHRAGALTRADRLLYWAVFIVVVVMPVDILCPPAVMRIFYGIQLNLWLLVAMWLRICYTAFIRTPERLAGPVQAA
ncbi:glycosyltransferase family 87 protein [uncultured Alistipes sp.]|uniref:glycosyltransferase family 87 protein n=1 Tax=uncultured Alistipes sp. TaxID=538949 RepID=UPI0025FD573D|nr:glycosyltransferase family 87 protein [uncultured Alistipes sp.]